MNGLNILSTSTDIEKAEETFKDQLTNITSHFQKQCMNILPPKSQEIDNYKIEFDRIEVKGGESSLYTMFFKENKEACRNLSHMIKLRNSYIFQDHSDCIKLNY